MNRVRGAFLVVTMGLVLGIAGRAHSGPLFTGPYGAGGTWNVYELAMEPAGATWDGARVNATSMSFRGLPGHLVTLGSAAENSFVAGIAAQLDDGDVWIGLTDATAVSTLDGFDPVTELGTAEFGATYSLPYPPAGQTPSDTPGVQRGEGWAWITGEPLLYQAWLGPNSPNDYENEDAAQMRDGTDGWSDNHAGATIGDDDARFLYIVEYETRLPAEPAVPEPMSLTLLGFGMLALLRRRRASIRP